MIRSAAIVKTKNPLSWKEIRLQKLKQKKAQALERKATKQVRPSPINKKPSIEETPTRIQEEPPTRSELEAKATELNLKFDGRTPDKKLFKMIEESLKGQ
jgi:hypothetical protein